MENKTDELKEWSKRLMMFGVIGVIGVALLATVLTGGPVDKQVEAQGGVEAITEVKTCDVLELEGRRYAICDDGAQYVLQEVQAPLTATTEGNQ